MFIYKMEIKRESVEKECIWDYLLLGLVWWFVGEKGVRKREFENPNLSSPRCHVLSMKQIFSVIVLYNHCTLNWSLRVLNINSLLYCCSHNRTSLCSAAVIVLCGETASGSVLQSWLGHWVQRKPALCGCSAWLSFPFLLKEGSMGSMFICFI